MKFKKERKNQMSICTTNLKRILTKKSLVFIKMVKFYLLFYSFVDIPILVT